MDFHRAIAAATHNPFYGVMLDSLHDVLVHVRQAALSVPGRRSRGQEYHERILRAIRDRDSNSAQTTMRERLDDVSRAITARGSEGGRCWSVGGAGLGGGHEEIMLGARGSYRWWGSWRAGHAPKLDRSGAIDFKIVHRL